MNKLLILTADASSHDRNHNVFINKFISHVESFELFNYCSSNIRFEIPNKKSIYYIFVDFSLQLHQNYLELYNLGS